MAAKSIFLIEDDKIYAEYLCKSLEQTQEYTVSHFLFAEDALQALSGKMPDALIVDFQLPKMSGIEFFEKIKDTSKETKIILLSAIDDGSMVLSFIQKGVRDYVIKDESAVESLQAILSGKEEDYFLFN